MKKDEEHARRHVDSVAHEKNLLNNISIESLIKMGYKVYEARNLVKISILLWNIIDSWYRNRIYSGSEKPILVREGDEASSDGSE